MKTIEYYIKNVYGNEMRYPQNETAKMVCEIAGKKTLTDQMINTARRYGYTVSRVSRQGLIKTKKVRYIMRVESYEDDHIEIWENNTGNFVALWLSWNGNEYGNYSVPCDHGTGCYSGYNAQAVADSVVGCKYIQNARRSAGVLAKNRD